MKDACRRMFTRTCPISGCVDLPCARFETEDESRWALDKIEWEKSDARLAAEAVKVLKERLGK